MAEGQYPNGEGTAVCEKGEEGEGQRVARVHSAVGGGLLGVVGAGINPMKAGVKNGRRATIVWARLRISDVPPTLIQANCQAPMQFT